LVAIVIVSARPQAVTIHESLDDRASFVRTRDAETAYLN
jgi:hypothetical protein